MGLMRHLMLCRVTLTFVAGHAEGLRGEKSGGDGGAGVPGVELRVRGVAGRRSQTTRLQYTSEVIGYHQRRNRRTRVPAAAGLWPTRRVRPAGGPIHPPATKKTTQNSKTT